MRRFSFIRQLFLILFLVYLVSSCSNTASIDSRIKKIIDSNIIEKYSGYSLGYIERSGKSWISLITSDSIELDVVNYVADDPEEISFFSPHGLTAFGHTPISSLSMQEQKNLLSRAYDMIDDINNIDCLRFTSESSDPSYIEITTSILVNSYNELKKSDTNYFNVNIELNKSNIPDIKEQECYIKLLHIIKDNSHSKEKLESIKNSTTTYQISSDWYYYYMPKFDKVYTLSRFAQN